MKKTIILTVLLLSVCSFAQTKKETTEWIYDKYDEYKIIKDYSDYSLRIGNNLITYLWHHGTVTDYMRIPIKNIEKIKITKKTSKIKGEEVSYLIILEGKGKESGRVEHGKYVPWDNPEMTDKMYSGVETFLNKDFGKNQLPQRMEKAFINLVRLYGGNPKIYKEAF